MPCELAFRKRNEQEIHLVYQEPTCISRKVWVFVKKSRKSTGTWSAFIIFPVLHQGHWLFVRGTSSTPNQYSFCLFTRRFFVFVCPLIPANSIESLLPGRAKPKTGLARQHDIIVCRWQSHRTVNLGPSNECLVTFYRETARLIPVLKTWLLSNAKETINDFGDCQTFRAKGKRYKNPRHGGRETARD